MRLLKTKLMSETGALEIEEFDDIGIPKYAILSHRWGNDEPTLQDVERGTTAKEGFKKVQQSCDMAKRDGIDYIWIDTCCIDKSSSSELSEAINSMYLWYFQAHRCYVYLADVPSKPFGESEWFTRGWTLQELLAPADLVFLNANWTFRGTKESLQNEIFNCTGIPVGILSGDEDLETCSIAQRMSWAAKRSTKRVEDLAYCLLGIFGINMPLLYGEGERAFIRIQEEIMRVSDDHSLFAWESPDNRGGILATSPAAFEGSGNIVQLSHVDDSHNTLTISSRGVHLNFQLIGIGAQKLGLALLRCKERDGSNNQIAIYVTDLTGTMETFRRVRSGELKRPDLAKIRSSQYLTRRACIQTGRIIPTRRLKHSREITSIKKYQPYDDNVLENFINLAQPEALLQAVKEGREDDIWLMLTRRNVEVNAINLKGWGEWPAWPALSYAANYGHEAVVKLLLARGADINLENETGYTPLLLATKEGHENTVKLLLERGASISMHIQKSNSVLSQLNDIRTLEDEILSDVIEEIRNVCGQKDAYDQLPAFVWAAKCQQENIIKLLLDKSAEGDLKEIYGPILLRWAARGGHKGIAEWLIDRGIDVNSPSYSYGKLTPVSIASSYGNEDILKLLLEKGGNIKAKDDMPLLYAAKHARNDTMKLLLETGMDINIKDNDGWTPLSLAAKHKHNETIRLLVKKGANMDAEDNDGRTPLLLAVEHEHDETIKLLINLGASIDAKQNDGRTPLLLAARNRHDEIVRLLIENGANVNAKDSNGQTSLSLAVIHQNYKTIKLLIEKRANINAKDENGRTSLSWAVTAKKYTNMLSFLSGSKIGTSNGSWECFIVRLLLVKGANIEAKDNGGRTPLSWAITVNQNEDIIQLLLSKGANIEAEDNDGRTPLSWTTTQSGSRNKAKLLLHKGANIEAKDNGGQTPLLWAITKDQNKDTVQLLLDKGANIEVEDNNGRTPLLWATELGNVDIIKVLIENGARVESKDSR